MDFNNRANRPAQSAPQSVGSGGGSSSSGKGSGKKSRDFKDYIKPLNLVLLVSVGIVLLGMLWLAIFYRPLSEARHVDSDKLQAVFLEGGQVYFGQITRLDDDYVRLNNIYYLRVNQQVQPDRENQAASQDVSLVKLGCELHGPQDQMLINRAKVTFWENLKEDGQVTQAVKDFQESNPNGQECDDGPASDAGADTTVPAGSENAGDETDTGAGTDEVPTTE